MQPFAIFHSARQPVEADEPGYGYGKTPRCSPLQQKWQTSHPLFQAIKTFAHINQFYSNNKATNFKLDLVLPDPSVLQPPTPISILSRSTQPALIDYVQLPMYLWIPEWFYPDLVHNTPCVVDGCTAHTRSGAGTLVDRGSSTVSTTPSTCTARSTTARRRSTLARPSAAGTTARSRSCRRWCKLCSASC